MKICCSGSLGDLGAQLSCLTATLLGCTEGFRANLTPPSGSWFLQQRIAEAAHALTRCVAAVSPRCRGGCQWLSTAVPEVSIPEARAEPVRGDTGWAPPGCSE